MRIYIPFFKLLLLIIVCTYGLTGCGAVTKKDVFDEVEEQIEAQLVSAALTKTEPEISGGMEVQSMTFHFGNLPEYWFNFGIYAKRWAAVIMVSSLALGWIVYDIFKRNKEVQKWAFDVLIVRIPAFTFLIIYVYAFLYRMLNL